MKIKELLQMDMEAASPIYLKIAQYAADQCTGCSVSPIILAFKAQQVMLDAHEIGENPIVRLNDFLGASIPEDALLTIIDE